MKNSLSFGIFSMTFVVKNLITVVSNLDVSFNLGV